MTYVYTRKLWLFWPWLPLTNCSKCHEFHVIYDLFNRVMFYYLRQRGYAFFGVSLFVSKIMQVLNRSSQNLVKTWHKPWKKPLEFGGYLYHVTFRVNVGFGLLLGGVLPCSTWEDVCYWDLFNSRWKVSVQLCNFTFILVKIICLTSGGIQWPLAVYLSTYFSQGRVAT